MRKIAKIIFNQLKRGNKILICGNGGSAAESNHFAAELVCKYSTERKAYPAISLCANQSVLTAISNDYGYQYVFARQIQAFGKIGDILVTMTTSGKSENIIRAETVAKLAGLIVIRLPNIGTTTGKIQENHLKIIHKICQYIDDKT